MTVNSQFIPIFAKAERSYFLLRCQPENVFNVLRVEWSGISITQSEKCSLVFELIVQLDHSFIFLLPLLILLTQKTGQMKSFLTDSQPGQVLQFCFMSAWMFLEKDCTAFIGTTESVTRIHILLVCSCCTVKETIVMKQWNSLWKICTLSAEYFLFLHAFIVL